jgi:hypothetical protein
MILADPGEYGLGSQQRLGLMDSFPSQFRLWGDTSEWM